MASQIEAASTGQLRARPLGDMHMRELLDAHAPGWKHEPMLVVDPDGTPSVRTGLALSFALLRLLGWRRSRQILSILATTNAQVVSGSPARRRILGMAGAGALAVGLGGLMPAPAHAAPEFTEDEVREIERILLRRPDIREARKRIAAGGYSLEQSQTVIIRGDHAGYLAMTFFAHQTEAENRAAALVHDFDGAGTRSTSVEFIEGSAESMRTESGFRVATASSGSPQIVTYGVDDYINCIAFCVGANCASQADKCRHLRVLYLVLACMVGICGSKVRTCHRICKSKW